MIRNCVGTSAAIYTTHLSQGCHNMSVHRARTKYHLHMLTAGNTGEEQLEGHVQSVLLNDACSRHTEQV